MSVEKETLRGRHPTLITQGNYLELSPAFKRLFLFGGANAEIRLGIETVLTPPVEMTPEDPSLPYGRQISDFQLKEDGLALTRKGERDYVDVLNNVYRPLVKLLTSERKSMFSYIILSLSPDSLSAVERLPDFPAVSAAISSFRLWALVERVHTVVSSVSKSLAVKDVARLAMSPLISIEAHCTNAAKVSTGLLRLESSDRPGYIATDALMVHAFLNSLTPCFGPAVDEWHRESNRLGSDLDYLATVELTTTWGRNHPDAVAAAVAVASSVSSTSPSHSALVAGTDSSTFVSAVSSSVVSRKSLKGSLGSEVATGYCSHCWGNGYRNQHGSSPCKYLARVQAKRGTLAGSALVSSSLVDPLVASLPTSGSQPSSAWVAPSASLSLAQLTPDQQVIRIMNTYPSYFPPPFIHPSNGGALLASASASAFSASVIGHPEFYYDNCASVSIATDIGLLQDVHAVAHPISIGGIGSSVLLTHCGTLPFLPAPANVCYWSPMASANLVSLRVWQANGGGYIGSPYAGDCVISFRGIPFDTALLHPVSGLPMVTPALIAAGYSSHSSMSPVSPPSSLLSALPAAQPHLGFEGRARADVIEDFHQGAGAHCSDDVLYEALSTGAVQLVGATCQDVRINRVLRGPCPQCAQGKMRNKPMPVSHTQPASSIGTLTGDIASLPTPSRGGNTVSLRLTDEFSGSHQECGAKSKSAVHLFDAIMLAIGTYYSAYGHTVSHLIFDAEPALLPVVGMLARCYGATGILLTFIDPGQHAQRIENVIGSSDSRARAIMAGLPFHLPMTFLLYLRRFVADSQDDLPNARSRPSCPTLLRTGARRTRHYKFPYAAFGGVYLVKMSSAQRVSNAAYSEQYANFVPVSEIGVLLGHSVSTPGDYDFVLANGQVVPRRVVGGPFNIIPFDWKRKLVLKAELAPPSTIPSPSIDARPVSLQSVDLSATSVTDSDIQRDASGLSPMSVSPSLSGTFPVLRPDVVSNASSDASPEPLSSMIDTPSSVPPIESGNSIAAALNSDPAISFLDTSGSSSDSSYVSPPSIRVSSRGASHSPGFWAGAGAHYSSVASPCSSCLYTPASDGFAALYVRCSACEDSSWTVVPPRSNRPFNALASSPVLSVVVAPALLTPLSVSPSHVAVARSLPSRVCRRVAPSLPIDDALTSSDLALIATYVAADQASLQAGLVAIELASFDTKCCDEFDLDEAVSHFGPSDTYAAAFTAAISEPSSDVSLLPFSLRPESSARIAEVPLRHALQEQDYAKLERLTKVEIDKQQGLGCLGRVSYKVQSELPSGSVVVHAVTLYKDKADGKSSCRIAGDGRRVPSQPSVVTTSSVSSDGDRMFVAAAMQAHAAKCGKPLIVESLDIVGGFLHVKRTSDIRMFLRFPSNLPHPLAGSYLEIFHALYGLEESNRLFQVEVGRIYDSVGFLPTRQSDQTRVKFDPVDRDKRCIVNIFVDDFRLCSIGDTNLAQPLKDALTARFGELKCSSPSTTFLNIDMIQHSNGALSFNQNRYIQRTASSIGVAHLPSVYDPACIDFYDECTSSALSVPCSPARYQTLIGSMIHILKTRDDVRPHLSHLGRFNAAPTMSHYVKALMVLRYLHSTPSVCRVFHSTATTFVAHCDAAFASFCENGRSLGAYMLTWGSDNAPFFTEARMQDEVATCPMTAEYYAAGGSCKSIIYFRQLSEDLGWPVVAPTSLITDSMTAIRLAVAPAITRKSRHMFVSHHHIRELCDRRIVALFHVPGSSLRVDVLTKIYTGIVFRRKRDLLFNLQSVPLLVVPSV